MTELSECENFSLETAKGSDLVSSTQPTDNFINIYCIPAYGIFKLPVASISVLLTSATPVCDLRVQCDFYVSR